MKAAILQTINNPLVIDEVGLTDLLFGQVLVKVLESGICGAQLQEIAGNKNNAAYVPHLLGHEGVAIVEKIGPGVTKMKPGDKVIMHWRKGHGVESDFPRYIFKGTMITSGKVTTFSEYSIVSENRITVVPHDTSNDFCALLGCGLSTALGIVNNEAKVKPGESVMVVGAGGVGLSVLRAATLAGASPIISVDIYENKSEFAKSSGADFFVNCKEGGIKDNFKKLGLDEIDIIVDTSGDKQNIEDTIQILSANGRYILVGQMKPGENIEIKNANHFFGGNGKMIKASQGGGFSPDNDIPRYIELYKSGILNIDGLITHRVSLDQINDAIDLVKKGQAGRIIIKM